MTRPKEWLVQHGHLPPGSENARGRISAENIARIHEAVAGGTIIDGYTPVTGSSVAVPKVERVAGNEKRLVDVPDEARNESLWTAHTTEGEIGMRTVCDTCRNSFTYCRCQFPKTLVQGVEAVVVFKPRPNPEKFRNRWW